MERMGIAFVEVGPDRLVATMPVEGNTQPYGLLHGGASVVLAETLGSFGSVLHAGPGRVAVGIDINATHHRAARRGVVTGTATPLHLGGDDGLLADRGHRRGRSRRSAPRGSPACCATRHPEPDGSTALPAYGQVGGPTEPSGAQPRRTHRGRAETITEP